MVCHWLRQCFRKSPGTVGASGPNRLWLTKQQFLTLENGGKDEISAKCVSRTKQGCTRSLLLSSSVCVLFDETLWHVSSQQLGSGCGDTALSQLGLL